MMYSTIKKATLLATVFATMLGMQSKQLFGTNDWDGVSADKITRAADAITAVDLKDVLENDGTLKTATTTLWNDNVATIGGDAQKMLANFFLTKVIGAIIYQYAEKFFKDQTKTKNTYNDDSQTEIQTAVLKEIATAIDTGLKAISATEAGGKYTFKNHEFTITDLALGTLTTQVATIIANAVVVLKTVIIETDRQGSAFFDIEIKAGITVKQAITKTLEKIAETISAHIALMAQGIRKLVKDIQTGKTRVTAGRNAMATQLHLATGPKALVDLIRLSTTASELKDTPAALRNSNTELIS